MPKLEQRLTELTAQNEDLRSQLALHREALEHMHHGLCMFDPDGRVTLCNRRYAEIHRLPPESVHPGMTGSEIVQLNIDAGHYPPGRTHAQVRDKIRAQIRAGSSSLGTMVRDGSSYTVSLQSTPNGNLVTTCEDITAQVEAEGALRESEARLRAILDAMPDCVKIFDENGTLVDINPKGLDLLQATDLASLSRPGYTPVPPEYIGEIIDVQARVMAGETVVWTYEVIGLAGRRRHVEAHSVPFHMPNGAKVHMCISRDVTDRKEADDALRRSEERLRLVQEATGLADFEAGADGKAHFSPNLLKQMGLPEDGPTVLAFEDWIGLVHPEDRDRLRRTEQTLKHSENVQSEFRIRRADTGEIRWIASSVRMERDEAGKVIRSIGAHLDITERKLAEEVLRLSGERLRLVQEATGLADFEAGSGGIVRFSDRFVEQTGLPPGTQELPDEQWMRIVHPDDRDRLRRDIALSLEMEDAFQCEFRIIRPDNGEVRWISSRTKIQRDEFGSVINTIGAHLDITERKRAEEALRESEERFRLAAEAAGLGVWDYDLTLDRREWSGRLRDIFGLAGDAESTLAVAEARIHPSDRAKFMRTLRNARDNDIGRFEASFRILRASDGAERWVTMNGWRTYKTDSQLRRIIMTVRDVTDEKTAEERIRWSASHDALTRLANRGLFQEKLDQAIRAAEADGGAVGLLLLDMDHFKQINDTLGHDAGDKLLQMFADRLRGVVRADDTVARLGGDEFAIVMPDIHTEQSLIQLTHSIQDRMREPFVHGGRVFDCRASMGASIFPFHGANADALLKNADIALYAAKGAGRATAMLYEPTMRNEMQLRTSMVQLARNALRDDRIIPYYQPKIDLADRSVIGFEALLRWRTPRGGIGSPASLQAAFEDLEVAAAISDRMIERVIADMRGWLDKGIAFGSVAINASAAEFRRDTFAERLLEQLHEARIPTRCLQLEVTETVFLGRGAEYVHRALTLLNARGVRIALDDFGTGYASLRHLKQFPVDIIKIDQSFVHDMADDPDDEAIIHAVINLGRSLGIKVVAEGIEIEAQAARLLELGCDLGQGFLFFKPLPARRVPAILARATDTAPPALPRPAHRPLRLVASKR